MAGDAGSPGERHIGSSWSLGGLVRSGSGTLQSNIGRNRAGPDFIPTGRTGDPGRTDFGVNRVTGDPGRTDFGANRVTGSLECAGFRATCRGNELPRNLYRLGGLFGV